MSDQVAANGIAKNRGQFLRGPGRLKLTAQKSPDGGPGDTGTICQIGRLPALGGDVFSQAFRIESNRS